MHANETILPMTILVKFLRNSFPWLDTHHVVSMTPFFFQESCDRFNTLLIDHRSVDIDEIRILFGSIFAPASNPITISLNHYTGGVGNEVLNASYGTLTSQTFPHSFLNNVIGNSGSQILLFSGYTLLLSKLAAYDLIP